MAVKKKQTKTAQVKRRAYKMSVSTPDKTRLIVSCTEEEKQYVRLLAAKHNMTMSEYLLSFARKEMPKSLKKHCSLSHAPNKETAKVLRDTDQGKNLIEHESLEEFWEALGFD
jgi:hypothetical protein